MESAPQRDGVDIGADTVEMMFRQPDCVDAEPVAELRLATDSRMTRPSSSGVSAAVMKLLNFITIVVLLSYRPDEPCDPVCHILIMEV